MTPEQMKTLEEQASNMCAQTETANSATPRPAYQALGGQLIQQQLNPDQVIERLYQKERMLREEMKRVREALSIALEDPTFQKLLKVHQAANPFSV